MQRTEKQNNPTTHSSALDFLNAVGGRLAAASGDAREKTKLLWQRMSVLLQRFNAVLVCETFVDADKATDL